MSTPEPEKSLEATLDQMKFIRDQVINRLVLARWLQSAQFLDAKGIQILQWNENGVAKIRTIHALLSELGYFSGGSIPMHRRGEFDDLMEFFASCIAHHGTIENPKTPPSR